MYTITISKKTAIFFIFLLPLMLGGISSGEPPKKHFPWLRPEAAAKNEPLIINLEELADQEKGVMLSEGVLNFPAKEIRNHVFVNVDFQARDYDELHIRLRSDKDAVARLNWVSDLATDFKTNHGVSFDIKGGKEFVEYHVPLPQDDGLWSGKISQLQFNSYWKDPAQVSLKSFAFKRGEKAVPVRYTARTGEHKTMPASAYPPGEWSFKVPKNARLFTAAAFSQLSWKSYPGDGARLSVQITDTSGKTESLYDQTLDPVKNEKHRGWQNIMVDLSPYAGKEVKLTFALDNLGSPTGDIVLWKEPIVYTVGANPGSVPLILISLDTARTDHFSVYGYERETTPWLKEWAKTDAVVFENAYTQDAWTLPAHTSMFTGLYPKNHAVSPERNLGEGVVTLAERLREEDYFGVGQTSVLWWLEAKHGFAQGFDSYANPLPYQDGFKTVDSVFAQLDALKSDRFFLFMHNYDAHGKSNTLGYKLPYQAEKPEYGKFAAEITQPPSLTRENLSDLDASNFLIAANQKKLTLTEEEEAYVKALYDDCLLNIDKALEKFIAGLKERGFYDNALIIITADHGESFNEQALWLHEQCYQNCSRVPMLVKFPKQRHGGERHKASVELVDIYPTALDVLGLPIPETLDGQSLLAQLESKVKADEFSYTRRHDVNAVYFQNWKLMNDTKSGSYSLYDLEKDPQERENLYDPASPIAIRMLEELARFYNAPVTTSQDEGTPANALSPEETKELEALGYFSK